MNEDQGFSIPLKIVIITALFVLVFVAIYVYSQKINKNSTSFFLENTSVQSSQDVSNSSEKIIVDQEKLKAKYQDSLKLILSEFNGNYKILQAKIVDLLVPSGFQNLHLRLVLSLNPAIYEDNPNLTKFKLKSIKEDYNWLASDLEKIISDI